jgi:hypothetical protein
MTWVAVAVVAAGALGAGASIYSGNKQAGAANNAANNQMGMFQQTQQNLQPWMNQGQTSLEQLGRMTGPHGQFMQPFGMQQFQQSPSYQFNLQQGQQAIDKAANARGNYYAPQTLQDISKFTQGVAGNDFNNAYNQYMGTQQQEFNMLNSLSSGGQNAAAGIGGFGSNAVQSAGQFQTSGAAAQGAGVMGASNAIAGGGLGLAGYGAYLNQLQSPQYMQGLYSGGNNSYGTYDPAASGSPNYYM